MNCTLILRRSTVGPDNTADVNGGGIYNNGGTLTMHGHSLVSGNTVGNSGSGIYNGVSGIVTTMNRRATRCTPRQALQGLAK